MRTTSPVLGSIKMTTAILLLVVISIVGSIAVVSAAIYANVHAVALADSRQQQSANLGAAATILERRMAGSALSWGDGGVIGSFKTWKIPDFSDDEIIDSVARVTRQGATVYAFDAATQTFTGKTTTITSGDGIRADLTIDSRSPAFSSLANAKSFVGEIDVNGEDYFGALQPVQGMTGDVLGAIFVGTPMSKVEASANGLLGTIVMVGGAVTTLLSLLGLYLSRMLTLPIPRLAASMNQIAGGDYTGEIPYTHFGNEVGAMARAVEVFRQNGLQLGRMTEAEAARTIAEEENRRKMMAELQKAFGEVVDAAVVGDFKRRVTVDFPDTELSGLAASVNRLVSTFDRSITEISGVLGAMAETDFTRRMSGAYEGAFAQLKSNVNAVADRLTAVLSRLRSTSNSLRTATGELLAGANDLSERTTRQAAAIEEASATIEQLSSTVLENAERAKDANNKSLLACQTAEDGGIVMNHATHAMEQISSSSGKISNIIGMIDDIAFQTNLLALNASVEAARAGDAGKGFAVVAVEVRRLAQSAAAASADVKELIEKSVQDVSGGTRLVAEAADKLRVMLEAAKANSGLMNGIARNSSEQAVAIEEVASAVRQMDEMTQHNASLVEETNAAIEQTEAQAIELDRIVGVFRFDTEASMPAPTVPRIEPRPRPSLQRTASYGNTALADDWNES